MLFVVAMVALWVVGPAVCLLAAGVLIARFVRLLRRVHRGCDGGDLGAFTSLGWLTVLVSVGTVEAYAYGALLYSPGLFPDKTCYFRMGSRTFPESSELVPLSTVCAGQEIVPFWFNPLMAALAVASAALWVVVSFAYARRRRAAGVAVSSPSERAG